MDRFLFLSDRIVDLAGLLADTANRSASVCRIIQRPAIIVAHLNQNEVSGLCISKHAIPQAFGLKSAAAASATGAVLDSNSARIKKSGDRVSPPHLPARAVFDGGIATMNKVGFASDFGALLVISMQLAPPINESRDNRDE